MIDGGSGDIRTGTPVGMFGSDTDREAWARECVAARRAMPKGRRFEVGPRMSVVTPSGVPLTTGSEVTVGLAARRHQASVGHPRELGGIRPCARGGLCVMERCTIEPN